ncbi:HAMP domain-containing sensor histidine kinase [Bogoriella caseilytica]|uniref:histidine kinase n=1 Tax=Bogoriella caseilytica TaxID=56055 RepID=A0A3N2BE16_9MICO|nr:HAMP domain-containing sensor histidine kinase [Bogoriella caseilytica]ROR73488.1 two-component system sensor histidine kinase MprB [Bogoriella caseilytica]
MSLRQRLTLLTAVAVALAIAVAASAAWWLVRSSIMDELDDGLVDRARQVDQIVAAAQGPLGAQRSALQLTEMVQSDPVGVQIIEPTGVVHQITFGPLTTALDAPGATLPPAPATERARLDTLSLQGERYRVVTASAPDGTVLRLFHPLAAVDATLSSVGWSLAGIAAAGIALAAVLGWLVSRAGLRPVNRLAAATERVARTQDLSERIELGSAREDEITRLAGSVNAMLAALDRARSDQRELVENASHELRTPLAVLRNDFGLLARSELDPGRALPPQERQELLRDLDTQVAALNDEVDGIITLAKGDQSSELPQRTDLRSLVERAVRRTRRLRPEVDVRVHGDPLVATIYPVALERAVANLVRNAVQVSPAGGLVEVYLSQADDHVSVTVEDSGPGLREEEIPKLFTRFFRGAGARDRHGSGLGLAIVAQAAAMHSGRATAENRAEGGARFTVHWPLRSAETTDQLPPNPGPAGRRT